MDKIKYGDKGRKVKEIQKFLYDLGLYKAKIDADFGPKTKKAVIAFQQKYMVTGEVGIYTLSAMRNIIDDKISKESTVPVPHGDLEVCRTFGTLAYKDTLGGRIELLGDWARKNIAKVDLPIVGKKWIHKKIVHVFEAALQDVLDADLDYEIVQFGTWSPRHKNHNPRSGISLHTWGIACDINWATNPPGKRGDIDFKLVEIFKRHGFSWGGEWKRRDDMHFQYATGV